MKGNLLSCSTKEHPQEIRLVKTGKRKQIDLAIALCLAVQAGMKAFVLKSSRKGKVYVPGQDDEDFSTEKFLQERMRAALGIKERKP